LLCSPVGVRGEGDRVPNAQVLDTAGKMVFDIETIEISDEEIDEASPFRGLDRVSGEFHYDAVGAGFERNRYQLPRSAIELRVFDQAFRLEGVEIDPQETSLRLFAKGDILGDEVEVEFRVDFDHTFLRFSGALPSSAELDELVAVRDENGWQQTLILRTAEGSLNARAWWGIESLESDHGSLVFPAARAGGASTTILEIVNNELEPIHVERVATETNTQNDAFFVVGFAQLEIPAGGVGRFTMEFRPDRPGPHAGLARVNIAGGLTLTIPLSAQTSGSQVGGTAFRRGDANGSGGIDITDGIFVFSYLFVGGETPACLAAADTDGTSNIDITDGIYLLSFLFLGGNSPPAPGVDCGEAPAGRDVLTCESYTSC
ncbi:MAG: hypothetical protein AAF517_28755, partial [Planctomycetota bacterium]